MFIAILIVGKAMFGPRLSLTIHMISYIGTTLLGTGAILTPTVFFDYYKQQNGMNDEDMKGFDMITGILSGASFALLVNLYCLQQRGIILSLRKSWREVCSRVLPSSSSSTTNRINVQTGATAPEIVNDDISIHKNPNHYYIPKINSIRHASQIGVEPISSGPSVVGSRRIRYTMPGTTPATMPGTSFKVNMKRSYMKRDFPPIRDITNHSDQV